MLFATKNFATKPKEDYALTKPHLLVQAVQDESQVQINNRIKSLAKHTLGSVKLDKYFTARELGGGDIYIKDELRPAERLLSEAVELRKECLPSSELDLASSLHKHAEILFELSKFDESNGDNLEQALKCCKEALTIQSKIFPPEHHDVQETQRTKKLKKEEKRKGEGKTESEQSSQNKLVQRPQGSPLVGQQSGFFSHRPRSKSLPPSPTVYSDPFVR